MSSASNCDLFEESKLCVSKLTNLVDRLRAEDEVVCQELCQSYNRCTHFTFMESKYPLATGKPDLQCYLWKRCISKVKLYPKKIKGKTTPYNFPYQISCSSMDCTSSAAGPKKPNMVDSCCSQFQTGVFRQCSNNAYLLVNFVR